MARHLGISAIEAGIVAVGVADGGFEVVADHERRRSAQKREQVDVGPDPVGQALAGAGLGVGVVRSAHRRDEQLHRLHFPGQGIDDVDGVAGEIHEHLLAAQMNLPHRRSDPPLPGLVGSAEPRVPETVGINGAILLPEQATGYVAPAELFIDVAPVGHRPLRALRRWSWGREKQKLQVFIGHSLRKRPAQPSRAGAAQVAVHNAVADAHAPRDGPLWQALKMF
ncbi:hypothetical protein ABH982_000010 [Bradyrhizobium ottawaense]